MSTNHLDLGGDRLDLEDGQMKTLPGADLHIGVARRQSPRRPIVALLIASASPSKNSSWSKVDSVPSNPGGSWTVPLATLDTICHSSAVVAVVEEEGGAKQVAIAAIIGRWEAMARV